MWLGVSTLRCAIFFFLLLFFSGSYLRSDKEPTLYGYQVSIPLVRVVSFHYILPHKISREHWYNGSHISKISIHISLERSTEAKPSRLIHMDACVRMSDSSFVSVTDVVVAFVFFFRTLVIYTWLYILLPALAMLMMRCCEIENPYFVVASYACKHTAVPIHL